MNEGSLSTSIGIRHPLMSVGSISAAMGVDPTAAHNAGSMRRSPSGRSVGGRYSETYWAIRVGQRSDAVIVAAIKSANDWVLIRSESFAELRRYGGTLEYFVTVTASDRLAVELPLDVLEQCVALGARLAIEVYPS